jgi:hypothetical protein
VRLPEYASILHPSRLTDYPQSVVCIGASLGISRLVPKFEGCESMLNTYLSFFQALVIFIGFGMLSLLRPSSQSHTVDMSAVGAGRYSIFAIVRLRDKLTMTCALLSARLRIVRSAFSPPDLELTFSVRYMISNFLEVTTISVSFCFSSSGSTLDMDRPVGNHRHFLYRCSYRQFSFAFEGHNLYYQSQSHRPHPPGAEHDFGSV